MPSAGSFRLWSTWEVGDDTMHRLDIGPLANCDTNTSTYLGFLRVGHMSADYDACSAMVRLGDNGTVLGPIDVPFTLVGEMPVTVEITPVSRHTNALRVILSVVPCADLADQEEQFANRLVYVTLNGEFTLPQWVRSVTALGTTQFSYADAGSIPLAGPLVGEVTRPSFARSIIGDVAGYVLLKY